ncbi:MAG: hypothetical protein R6W06_14050 [Prochlorococcaceae cyanobacterium]
MRGPLHPSPARCLPPQRRSQPLAATLLGSLLGIGLGTLIPAGLPLGAAPSDLLDRVKQNPQQARALCAELRALNSQGISALSPRGLASVAQSQGLSSVDAEVLTTYVVGLHCPDVR